MHERLVDNHRHSLLAMLGLGAVDPDRRGVIDGHLEDIGLKRHVSGASNKIGISYTFRFREMESGKDASVRLDGYARLGEGGLHD